MGQLLQYFRQGKFSGDLLRFRGNGQLRDRIAQLRVPEFVKRGSYRISGDCAIPIEQEFGGAAWRAACRRLPNPFSSIAV